MADPWDGMDYRDDGTQEWVEALTDEQYDRWCEWREAAERAEWDAIVEAVMRDPDAPPEPSVCLVDASGNELQVLVSDQPFHVELTLPYTGEQRPEAVEVTFRTERGEVHTLDVAPVNWGGGRATFRSEQVTTAGGAEGGSKIELPWVEFRTGGMDAISLRDGEQLTVSAGGHTLTSRVFTTVTSLRICITATQLAELDRFLRNLLVNLRSAATELASAPDSDEKRELLQLIAEMQSDAEHRLGFVTRGQASLQDASQLDHVRLALGEAYLGWIKGPLELDRRLEADVRLNAIRSAQEEARSIVLRGVAQATIGAYQLLVTSTGVAQVRTMLYGVNELGQHVSDFERFMAFVDVLTQAAMSGAFVTWNYQSIIRPRTAGVAASDPAPTLQPRQGSKPLEGAAPNERVPTSETVGMTPEMSKRFQAVIDRMSGAEADGGLGARVVAVQRPAASGGVRHHLDGSPGKPEPVKAKGVNQTDIEGGWADPATLDTTAVYTPDQISRAIGVPTDQIVEGAPRPAHVSQRVWDRAIQRVKEFGDETPMLDELTRRGLVERLPNGQLIDRGASNYGLDPETGKLVQLRDGPAQGTGKPFAPDPDPYEMLWYRPGAGWVRMPDWAEARLTVALHEAGVQHGPVAHWKPIKLKDEGIKAKIIDAHQRHDPLTGAVVAGNEALVIFGGRAMPRLTTYGDMIPDSLRIAADPGRPGPVIPGTAGPSRVVPRPWWFGAPDSAAESTPSLPYLDDRAWWAAATVRDLEARAVPTLPGWEWAGEVDVDGLGARIENTVSEVQHHLDGLGREWSTPAPVAPVAAPATVTAALPGTVTLASERPRSRRRTGVLVASGGIVAALVVGGVIVAGGDDDDERQAGAIPAVTTAAPASEPSEPVAVVAATVDTLPDPPAEVTVAPQAPVPVTEPATTPPPTTTPPVPADPGVLTPVAPVLRALGAGDSVIGAAAASAFADAEGDWIYSVSSVPPGAPGPASDVLGAAAFVLDEPQAEALTCGAGGFSNPVLCDRADAPQPSGSAAVITVWHGQGLPARWEPYTYVYGLVFDSDGEPNDNFVAQPPFDWDFYQQTDLWYEVVLDGATGGISLTARRWNGTEAVVVPTSARVIIEGGGLTWVIPRDELGDVASFRATSFCHDGSFMPEVSSGDVTGADPTQPLIMLAPQA